MAEQYWMPKELDFENLRLCLDHYSPDVLYVRLVGSAGGAVKVNERLEGRTLDFKKNKSGLYLLIDSDEVFHFPLNNYQKDFSLEYERIEPTEDGIGKMIILQRGVDPYDPTLPEPTRSFLRTVLDRCLLEIHFKGRVNLKFHSWWIEPDWKYWVVDKPDNGQCSIRKAILKQRIEYDEEDS